MAVGKSTLARALGKHLNWPVVDKDDVADVLVNYLSDYSPPSYDIMFKQVESLLEQAFNVIVVSSFRGEVGLRNAATLAVKRQADFKIISCLCSDKAEWKHRLESRKPRPAHLITTWQDFEKYWREAEAGFEQDADFIVDTSAPLVNNINRASIWLST